MDPNLAQYRQALTGASQIAAPTPMAGVATPANLVSTFSNLAKLAQSGIQGSAAKLATGAAGGASGAVENQNQANAQLQLKQEQDNNDALNQAKKDANDPSKYRKEIASDGGYEFFDPQGNKIDVKQYSAATGQHITDVLKNSQNPEDQQFVSNYKNVLSLTKIYNDGSKDEFNKFMKTNPDAKKDYDLLQKSLGHTPSSGDVITALRQSYPQFFNTAQPTTIQGNRNGNFLQSPSIKQNIGNLFDKIKSAL